MALDQIKTELENIVQDLGLKSAKVKVEQNRRWVHVQIVSEDFRNKSPGERENLIWRGFERHFDDETILSITQCYLLTPEERAELSAA